MTLHNANNTNTRCWNWAGYCFVSDPVNINFCCFISNDSDDSGICMHHNHTPDSFVKKSIFKNNSVKISDTYHGLLTSTVSNVTVSECIFLGNKAKNTFGANSRGSIMTVISCIGDYFSASSDSSGKVITNEMKTDSFNLTLRLLSLGHCEAENPFSFELFTDPDQNVLMNLQLNFMKRRR